MGKTTIFLMALAVALTVFALADATPPGLRRSRFLSNTPSMSSNCNNKTMPCEKAGGPWSRCCNVCAYNSKTGKTDCSINRCVDTKESFSHCGGCKNTCKYGETCCNGKCVDLMEDDNNCGECDFSCDNDAGCDYGFCAYAG